MSRTDLRTLIDRGRKSGLRTADLYGALTSRRPEGSDHASGRADTNGFVAAYSLSGRVVYQPISSGQRA